MLCHYFGYAYGSKVTVMLCFLALGYHDLLASITFKCSCLLVVHVGVGYVLRCMTIVYYRVPLICIFHWISLVYAHLVILPLCSCMVFLYDASGHAMLMIELCWCYPCSSACHAQSDICFIVVILSDLSWLHIHAHVGIMLMYFSCIMLFLI